MTVRPALRLTSVQSLPEGGRRSFVLSTRIMESKQVDRTVAAARKRGGGKSELRRAVCRITSGLPASRLEDGQCHRKHTASRLAGSVRVKRCGKSAPPGQ